MATTETQKITGVSVGPRCEQTAATRRGILGGLALAVVATVAAFPFEPVGAHEWTGLLFIVGALALMTATLLLATAAVHAGRDLAAVGFGAVALYGFGTTLDSSLLARGLPDVSVGVLPAMWAVLALGLLLVGLSDRFPAWARTVGLLSAAGHAVVAVAVLFGAEMPPTGADPSAWQGLLVAVSKVLFLVTLLGWAITVRKEAMAVQARRALPEGWGVPIGTGMGAGLGLVLGVLLGQIALGLAVGAGLGLVAGAALTTALQTSADRRRVVLASALVICAAGAAVILVVLLS